MSDSQIQRDVKRMVCQACNFQNAPGSVCCSHCGVALTETTVLVPEKPLDMTRTNYLGLMTKLYNDALVLLISAQDQMVVLKGQQPVTLGRYQENEPPPTIDMTVYGGHHLGVSRRHVTITPHAEGYTLEDLGSANGTFVNERRLTPNQPYTLRNGDLVRVGQLLMFIYFTPHSQRGAHPVEQNVTLIEKAGGKTIQEKLTLARLTRKVLPYLDALAELQAVVNEVMDRPMFDMTISNLKIDQSDGVITVTLLNYPDAVRLVQKRIVPWRQARTEAMLSLLLDIPADDETTERILPAFISMDSDVPSQEVLYICHDLASSILNEIAPDLADDAREKAIEKLLLPLYTLAVSRLEIVV